MNTNFLIGLAAGVVVGAIGYKLVVVDKKINVNDLSRTVNELANRFAPKQLSQAQGQGQGQGQGRSSSRRSSRSRAQ